MSKPNKTALVMAGGTGGHIFPGLAVAEALRARGWTVHWIGAPNSMESELVPARDFPFEAVEFGGVRGKGLSTLLQLPLRMRKAIAQSSAIMQRVQPGVVIGFGGYITAPAGIAAAMRRIPVVLHEQNSVPGMANKWLAKVARYTEEVDIVKGEKRRRLHKAFLRYHDPNNWPLLREALKDMGRADLIGNSKQHLIPTYQPQGTEGEYKSARKKNSTVAGDSQKRTAGTRNSNSQGQNILYQIYQAKLEYLHYLLMQLLVYKYEKQLHYLYIYKTVHLLQI